MTDTPTGRRAECNGTVFVEFERTFAAPIDDMWAAVTESERLERWIGQGTGDPASGEITFRMTAEGPDVPEETIYIDQCEKPTLLTMRSARPDDPALLWKWRLELHEEAGVTTLTFAQEAVDVDLVDLDVFVEFRVGAVDVVESAQVRRRSHGAHRNGVVLMPGRRASGRAAA